MSSVRRSASISSWRRRRTRAIDGGERLVEQQHGGLARQRPGQRHPLTFAAGQFVRPPVDLPGQVDQSQQRAPRARAVRRAGRCPSAVDHVARGGQVREERVFLEDEPDRAAMRRRERARGRVGPRLGARSHGGMRRPVEAGDAPQDGRLAAAGRTEDREHVARAARERDVERNRRRPDASVDRQAPVSHDARRTRRDSAVVAISVATRDDQQRRRHHARAAIVERLHPVVDRDAQRARLAGQVAADHQHDAELAERVRERQDRRGQDAGPGERHLDARGSAATASGRSRRPRRARRPEWLSKPR